MTDDTLPWEEDEGGFTATFKAGKGYEDPWFIIRDKTAGGLKRRIIAAFGWDAAEVGELTLVELIFNATQAFHANRNVGREFPGSRAMSGRGRGSKAAGDEPASDDTPAEPAQAEPAELTVLQKIEAITTETTDAIKTFKLIWVNHNPLSAEEEAAWLAKGKALREAGLK